MRYRTVKCETVSGYDDRFARRVHTALFYTLNLTCVMFLIRGVLQAVGTQLSAAADASISGIAGVGHILLGIGIVLTLLQIRNAVRRLELNGEILHVPISTVMR